MCKLMASITRTFRPTKVSIFLAILMLFIVSDTGDVDEGLLKELEQLQQQTEGVLEQVVRYRRAFPGKAADKLSAELSALFSSTPSTTTPHDDPQNDCVMEEAGPSASEQVLSRLASNVEKTIQLREQVPKTVAKLERARTVLAEEGQKRVAPIAATNTAVNSQWALAVGGAVGEGDLNDVLTRHRRTSHQFDLAHKLSTAASQFY